MGCAAAASTENAEELRGALSAETPQTLDLPNSKQAIANPAESAPDSIAPKLPRFQIDEPKQRFEKHQHELLTEDPELDEQLDFKTGKSENTAQAAKNAQSLPPIERGPNEQESERIKQQADGAGEDERNDSYTQQKRKIKKLIRPKRSTAEYEFNDNLDAQRVILKEKGVFDQIERDQLHEMKAQALQRPGSAGVRKNDQYLVY